MPNDPRVDLNLALAYEKSGRLPEATKRLEGLHASLPQEKQVTMLLADAYLQAGENGQIIELLRPLEKETPDDPAIAYLLGTALIRQQRISEGQVVLDRILKNGETAEARFLLGMQMYESGDYPASVKQFASASDVNPKLPELQSYYGAALLTTGDADGAAAAFQRELEANPNNYLANLELGQILAARKKYDEALPLLKQALFMRPQSGEAELALGQCLRGQGKLTQAREMLQAASHAMPESAEAHMELARVDGGLQMTQEARHERLVADHLRQAAEAKSPLPGPKRGELAPDFSLPNAATSRQISLRDFHGKSPVVLIFGSYTCPNFRSSAEALKALAAKFGKQVPFLLIYIREAHTVEDWQSTRNEREGVDLPRARTLPEKQEHAMICSRSLHLPFPALLDGLDNKVEKAYGAWPSRAFVIGRDGSVVYSSHLTELDFSAEDMDAALRDALSDHQR